MASRLGRSHYLKQRWILIRQHGITRCKKCSHCLQSLCNRHFSVSSCYQNPTTIKESYSLLEVEQECTENDIREAYLRKVKEYHPDSSTNKADAAKFNKVQEAYQVALEHHKGRNQTVEENVTAKADSYDFDIQHTVPQHRRYLTFEGIGSGTPSQRQRQYKQYRVHQASENVYEHRKMKLAGDENALALKDQDQARKIKISNLIHRVVDDLIRESMQKGDFDNLSGKGRPLDYSNHNPHVDTTTHNVNKILVNNGFKPEWIMLSKEIRDNFSETREQLAIVRHQLGSPPYSEPSQSMWIFHVEKFKQSVSDINIKINRFNNIVPLMEKQMVHYDVLKNMQKVVNDHHTYLPKDKDGQQMDPSNLPPLPQLQVDDSIKWVEVWTNIKELFKSK